MNEPVSLGDADSGRALAHRLVRRVGVRLPEHARILESALASADDEYFRRFDRFMRPYEQYCLSVHRDVEFCADSYSRMFDQLRQVRAEFLHTGRYPNSSFKDVEAAVYANPGVMECHMHGLALAQFLWPDQYARLCFFIDRLPAYAAATGTYLEVGGGHALYISEAMRLIGGRMEYTLVDISRTSIEFSKAMIGPAKVEIIEDDILNLPENRKFDFITVGEVIEHLEDPLAFLRKLRVLLADDGVMYVTTPANAPMVDHIYLFESPGEIRRMLQAAGFQILEERVKAARDLPEDVASRMKLPIMFAAFVGKLAG